MTHSFMTFRRAATALAVFAWLNAALVACSESPSAPASTPRPADLEVTAATPVAIEAAAGSTVDGPAVRVIDRRSGLPVAGMLVEFTTNAGSVENPSVRTDESGIATSGKLYAPEKSGSYEARAATGIFQLAFVVNVRAATPSIMTVFDSSVAGLAGRLAAPPIVKVTDRFGNPAPGVRIDFEVVGGAGHVKPSFRATNETGLASPDEWQLSNVAGENALVAKAAGLEAITFRTRVFDSASVEWFELDSIAIGSIKVSAWELGVLRGRLALTPFDACLCVAHRGYFVVEVEQRLNTPSVFNVGGSYSVEPPRIHMHGEFGIRQMFTSGFPVFVIDDQFELLAGGRLELDIQRWNPVWEEWTRETWSYKK